MKTFRSIVFGLLLLPSLLIGQIAEDRALQESGHRTWHASYDPGGRYIATSGMDHNIMIWNLDKDIVHRTLAGLRKRTRQVAFSSDGSLLWSVGDDGMITTWDIRMAQIINSTRGHAGAINALAVDRQGKRFATAGNDKLVRLWTAEREIEEAFFPYKGHKKAVTALDFSPDGKLLASVGADRRLILWDLETGMILRETEAHKGWGRCVRFSPDGNRLATGGDDRIIRIWDTWTLEQLDSLAGHEGWVQSLSYSPSGDRLISGGHDQSIRIWDTKSGKQIAASGKLENVVLSVDADPGGKGFVSACMYSEKIRIWDFENDMDGQTAIAGTVRDDVDQAVTSGQEEIVASAGTVEQEDSISSTGTVEQEQSVVPAGDESVPMEETAMDETPREGIPKEETTEEENPEAGQPELTGTEKPGPLEAPPQASPEDIPEITIFSPLNAGNTVEHKRNTLLVVGKADADAGIMTVVVGGQRAELNEAGVFQAEIELMKGENQVDITAVSKRGKMGMTGLTVNCISETAKVSADRDGFPAGRYYALIIAVNEYEDKRIEDLDYPLSDADSIFEVLVKHYSFMQEDITLLKNPTREEMIISLEEMAQKVTETDNLLIFYAGHGYWDEKTGIGYWLPANASRTNSANWFRNSTLRDFIGSINSKHTLLIADACFSGSIFKTRGGFTPEEQGVLKLHGLPSRKAMTSGALKEVPDKSVFVKYLLTALWQNQADYLPSESLFGSFKSAILSNSPNVPQYGTIQNVGDQGGDFIFRRR